MGFNPIETLGGIVDSGVRSLGHVAEECAQPFEGALQAAKSMSVSDIGHTVFDGVGMIPVIGAPADAINAGWYAAEGKWTDAALSAAAVIPVVGEAATAAKWGKRAVTVAEAGADVAKTLKHVDEAGEVAKLAKNADEAADGAKVVTGAETAGVEAGTETAEKAGNAASKKPGQAEGDGAGKANGDDGAGGPKGIKLTTIQRTEGRNTMEWNVDGEGRFVSGKASFFEDFAGRKTRGREERAAQKEAASRGVDGDQGGHMFAHRFVRDQGSINLVPQNGDLNNVAWGHMENEWADWIKSGKRVDVEIHATPAGADRPNAFRVNYDVVDPSNGKVVYSYSKRFLNEAGQEFNRVSAKDIEHWKG
jgi:hypothetical protein